MKIYVKMFCVCIILTAYITGCTGKSDIEEPSIISNELEVPVEKNQELPIEVLPEIEKEEAEPKSTPTKQVTDQFMLDNFYYYKEEEVWYPAEYWINLEKDCVEAIEGNEWESFIAEYSAPYHVMTQEEKVDHARRDMWGVLDCYISEMGMDDTWMLYTEFYDWPVIFIQTPFENEENQYIYYIFEKAYGKDEHISYYTALRALGNDEFFFLRYEGTDFFVLVYRSAQGELEGIAIHEYAHGEEHFIFYFDIESGNHVSQVLMYGVISALHRHMVWDSSYWPEYP